MDRIVLLGLLAIPVLVVIHVALVWQPTHTNRAAFWTEARDEHRVELQGYWQSPEPMLPARFVVEQKAEQGS